MVPVETPDRWRWHAAPQVVWQLLTFRGGGLLAPEHDVDQPGTASRSIVLASSQRTGSTLLGTALRRTGCAGVPLEYFTEGAIGAAADLLGAPRLPLRSRARRQVQRARLRHDWAATWDVEPGTVGPYLDHLVRCRTTPNGVFALKVHWNHYAAMMQAGLPIEAFPQPVSWVRVVRRDRLAQAVSLARARQSGQWSAAQVVRRRRPYEPFFDETAITAALADVDAWNAGWQSYFSVAGITPIRVVYEDLVADYPGEMGRLFDALDLDVVVEPNPPMRRQADEISASWIERYRALHPDVGV
jgi:LPS sulfotransferase NodH